MLLDGPDRILAGPQPSRTVTGIRAAAIEVLSLSPLSTTNQPRQEVTLACRGRWLLGGGLLGFRRFGRGPGAAGFLAVRVSARLRAPRRSDTEQCRPKASMSRGGRRLVRTREIGRPRPRTSRPSSTEQRRPKTTVPFQDESQATRLTQTRYHARQGCRARWSVTSDILTIIEIS